MTRLNYAEIPAPFPLIFIGGWTGYGIYEAAPLPSASPSAFMKFSREFDVAGPTTRRSIYVPRRLRSPGLHHLLWKRSRPSEKRKPGAVAKGAFADHPQTPDRILHSQEEIARILPAKDEYMVTTSEFDDVKARLARIENKRRLTDTKGVVTRPSLRRAGTTTTDPTGSSGTGGQTSSTDPNSTSDDKPTLASPRRPELTARSRERGNCRLPDRGRQSCLR